MSGSDSAIATQPMVKLLLDGTPRAGITDLNVIAGSSNTADRFRAEIAIGADPDADLSYWAGLVDGTVQISVSLDGGQSFTDLIEGDLDQVEVDFVNATVRLSGRDLSARLIDTPMGEAYSDQRASDIATTLATKHNLQAQVTATQDLIGRDYQDQRQSVTLARGSKARNEWDFLRSLAEHEQYDLYVIGETLYFQPSDSRANSGTPVDVSGLQRLSLQCLPALLGNVTVTVQSWHSKQQQVVSATATQTGASSSTRNTSYTVVRPNLTDAQANTLAQQKLADVLRFGKTIRLEMPGELTTTARDTLALQGTGTDADGDYVIDELERRIDARAGFLQIIRAHAVTTPE